MGSGVEDGVMSLQQTGMYTHSYLHPSSLTLGVHRYARDCVPKRAEAGRGICGNKTPALTTVGNEVIGAVWVGRRLSQKSLPVLMLWFLRIRNNEKDLLIVYTSGNISVKHSIVCLSEQAREFPWWYERTEYIPIL